MQKAAVLIEALPYIDVYKRQLMGVPLTFVFTHDSIGVGEDGPTHEPIEQLAMLRAMPNFHVYLSLIHICPRHRGTAGPCLHCQRNCPG